GGSPRAERGRRADVSGAFSTRAMDPPNQSHERRPRWASSGRPALGAGLSALLLGCGSGGAGSAASSGASSASSSASAGTGGAGGAGQGGATTGAGGAGGAPACAACEIVATLPAGSAPYGLFVDDVNVYWTNAGTGEVMQAKTDGTSPLA